MERRRPVVEVPLPLVAAPTASVAAAAAPVRPAAPRGVVRASCCCGCCGLGGRPRPRVVRRRREEVAALAPLRSAFFRATTTASRPRRLGLRLLLLLLAGEPAQTRRLGRLKAAAAGSLFGPASSPAVAVVAVVEAAVAVEVFAAIVRVVVIVKPAPPSPPGREAVGPDGGKCPRAIISPVEVVVVAAAAGAFPRRRADGPAAPVLHRWLGRRVLFVAYSRSLRSKMGVKQL